MAKKLVDPDNLTASQEEMPPPGIPVKRGPTTRSQGATSRLPDRMDQFKPTISASEMKDKRAQDQLDFQAEQKQKQLLKIRDLQGKISPSKGTPPQANDSGALSHRGLSGTSSSADFNPVAISLATPVPEMPAHAQIPAAETFNLAEAFQKLNVRLDAVDSKLNGVITKSDLTAAIEPLQQQVSSLDARVSSLESNGSAGLKSRVTALECQSSTGGLSPEQIKLLNALDPALKCICFSGFPAALAPAKRIDEIEAILTKLPTSQHVSVENVMTGPANNRSITKHVVVEFPSKKLADNALAQLGGKGKKFVLTGGSEVSMKMDITKFNRQRNWALYKAKELISKSPGGASAVADMQERQVKVDSEIAFKQEKYDSRGSFCGAFSALFLPP